MSTVPSNPGREHRDKFVTMVAKACRHPGTRAGLRTGLGKPVAQAPRMHRVVAPLVPAHHRGPQDERAYYTVAALIAARRPDRSGDESEPDEEPSAAETPPGSAQQRRQRDMGYSVALAVLEDTRRRGGRRRGGDDGEHPLGLRLHLLVRQTTDGAHRQLPGLVRYLRSTSVPIDWAQLLEDLLRWPTDRDRVVKRWLQNYYRTLSKAPLDDHEPPEE